MIIELLMIMFAWVALSSIIKVTFGVPFFVAFIITLICLILYDFIHEQTDSQGG